MNESLFEILIYWDKSDGIFVAEVPELPGCIAHGSTKAEALQHIEETINLWIKSAREDGIEIPQAKGKLAYA
jgi:predicted RNase H-like HicB family nuclease